MMLNDGWSEGMTAAEVDAAAEEMYRDAHPCCLHCEKQGCLLSDCPAGSCGVEPLVTHDGELMHAGCTAAWDHQVANAIPVAIDIEETTPIAYEPMAAVVFGGLR